MIKVSDYIAKKLAEAGVRHVFMITGGGAMHLNDSFGNSPDLFYLCNHHEQASAIAAEGYYRASGRMAVVNVTSGPGGTNTLTGVIGQWLDSIPCLYLSGQVRQATTIAACPELGLRQLGDQEINIVDIVRPVTKYAVMVRDPLKVRYHLEKALYLASHGRPGPVWLDMPLDVQAAKVDQAALEPYDPREDELVFDPNVLAEQAAQVVARIRQAKRPVILAGHGIRLAGGAGLFLRWIEQLNVPVLTTINGHDLIPSDHRLFFGRPGIVGDRLGNLMIQNSDLLVAVGARMGVRQISYNFDSFAREAFKVMVDIDPAELKKPTLHIDLPIHADAGQFMEETLRQTGGQAIAPREAWLAWGRQRRASLPSIYEDNSSHPEYVNSYLFADRLFEHLAAGAVVVTGNGTAYTCPPQVMRVKPEVRFFSNQGCAAMGYDLPAAIGASVALDGSPVVLITGDGSLQMNIQELHTVAAHGLPVKIFVLNNRGYLAIRITQDSYFEGRHYGSDASGGLTLPNLQAIAQAYGIPATAIRSEAELDEKILEVLAAPGPYLCEVLMDPQQTLYPKLSSVVNFDGNMISAPLEDMYPFLAREEFRQHMIIEPFNPAKRDGASEKSK